MPLPFLFSVIRNKALHFLRHESIKLRAHEEISDDAARELQFRIDTLEACDPHSLYADDVQMILRRTLDSLGEKTDKVFILSRFEGMSNKDISSELGISSGQSPSCSRRLQQCRFGFLRHSRSAPRIF